MNFKRTDKRAGEYDDEFYTPKRVFVALNTQFDLDPCSPGPGHWVPAEHVYTKVDDGLTLPWHGFVWMNPPFGGTLDQVHWIRRLLAHGNGIGLLPAYTSARWFHQYIFSKADGILFPSSRLRFYRPTDTDRPTGVDLNVVLFAVGRKAQRVLKQSNFGWYMQNPAKYMPDPRYTRTYHGTKL